MLNIEEKYQVYPDPLKYFHVDKKINYDNSAKPTNINCLLNH